MPDRDGYAHGAPCWVDLSSDDIEGAKAFYSGLFGWEWDDQEGPDGGFMYSLARLGGRNAAGLGPAPEEMVKMGLRGVWNVYMAVDSLDEAYQGALDAGGAGVVPPFDVMDAGRMAYITDDQGVRVGLWQAGSHKGAGAVNEPGAFSWCEVYVPDTEAGKRFYGRALGMVAEPAGMAEMDYTLLKVRGKPVAGLMAPPEGVPPCWSVYFGVSDAEQAASRVAELGGEVVNGPFPTPMGPLVVAQDPSGGVFLAMQSNQQPEECSDL